MTITIEIPDDQASVLEAKAAADGLTLKDWLEKLARHESILNPRPLKSVYGMLAKYGPAPSAEEIDENRREILKGFPKDVELG
jgi:hypothetical protein